jgi:Mannosyltransferase putative
MMIEKGIYTLANDNLYDQVIALVNSIRKNYDSKIPICIIPYDEKISKLKSLNLENVFLFNNEESLEKWQNFASEVWNNPRFLDLKQTAWYHGSNTIRKLCSFDGIFEKFIYIDSDALVMSSLEDCFDKLNEYDCIFDDWEHKKQECFLAVDLINQKYQHSEEYVKQQCHCSDFFAAKSSLINKQVLNELKFSLFQDGEVNLINSRGWWDEVYLFSYMTFKLNSKIFNYTLSLDSQDRTGNIAGVDPFVEKDQVLFNQEGLKPIHRIHYMGYKSEAFTRLCKGEDTNIPHQEVFLYYRFMNQPDQAPTYLKKADFTVIIYQFLQQAVQKMKKKLQTLKSS